MEAKINKSAFFAAGIYIILGIVMIVFPETTMKTFCLVLGIIGVVLGMINLVSYFSRNVMDSVYRYDFAGGIVMILAGIVFIVKMDRIIELIPIILGVLIIASGLIKLQHSIDLKRIEYSGWVYVLVFSLLCLSVGTVCVLQPDFIASTLVVILGISFLFCGITDLVTLVFLSKRMKEFTKGSVGNNVSQKRATSSDNTETKKGKRFLWGKKSKESEAADNGESREDKAEEENEAKDQMDQAASETIDIFKDSVTYNNTDTGNENESVSGDANDSITTEKADEATDMSYDSEADITKNSEELKDQGETKADTEDKTGE